MIITPIKDATEVTIAMVISCTFIEVISFWYCVDFLAKNSVFFF